VKTVIDVVAKFTNVNHWLVGNPHEEMHSKQLHKNIFAALRKQK
jgi:hypothetical protein